MIVDNRLVLTISKQRHPTENSFWFIGWINVPEMKMHVRLNRCIPEVCSISNMLSGNVYPNQLCSQDRETSTVALSSVIMEVVSVLCREGIWQNLLKMPAQPRSLSSPNELVSEMGDLTAPELTKSETADPSGPLTRESIKELLKAFFRARRKWPERFHNEMASVNLQAIVRDNWPGTTTCHALYNCPLGEPIKGGVVLDPSRLVLRVRSCFHSICLSFIVMLNINFLLDSPN